jgi:hypothetical protein
MRLARDRGLKPGTLYDHVAAAGVKAGYPVELREWSGPQILFAVDTAKAFEQSVRPPARSGATS